MTKKEFKNEFCGHYSTYSSVMLIGEGLTVEKVIKALEEMMPKYIDQNTVIGSGYGCSANKPGYEIVGFEICKEMPDIIVPLTKKLNCIGYADTAWDEYVFLAAKNGEEYNEYKAAFVSGCPDYRNGEDCWDAFVDIEDKETGALFSTGAGAVDDDTMMYFKDIVRDHQ